MYFFMRYLCPTARTFPHAVGRFFWRDQPSAHEASSGKDNDLLEPLQF